ncbi:MAG: ABC transporter permease [Desulfitobacterium hafniense]|nr:ABC transporter permease [Desulfitobacterium hafniense]
MNKPSLQTLTINEEFADKIRIEYRNTQIIKWAPILVLLALIIFFSVVRGNSFASLNNLVAILNQLAIPLLVACGLTFVIMLGSIDLSIDGTVGMAGSLLAVLVLNSKNTNDLGILGIVLAILASVLVGFIIGSVHVKLKIPSFMVSFGFLYIGKGIATLSYGGIPAQISDSLLMKLPKVVFLGIPFITWIAIIMFVVSFFIQEYTPLGRHIFAVGTDENIPRSVGVNVDRVKIKVFTYAGLLFGIAGALGAIRLGQGQAQIGQDLMFPAQAAVVVGGTSLSGGKGGVVNTLIGTIIIVVLDNGLALAGVNPYIKTGIQGFIILTAVALTISRGHKVISK